MSTKSFNTDPPKTTVKLVFIHHSCGENWLSDDSGRLGIMLAENNYLVCDTDYGWGPDEIGNKTDIGDWWLWFRSPQKDVYTDELYKQDKRSAEAFYTRLKQTVDGENEIIMFKSCFPNSYISGSIGESVPFIESNLLRSEKEKLKYLTAANAKGIYIDLLRYFETRPDKLFIAVTAPPLPENPYKDNARYFNNWLVYEWLKDYPLKNVRVFDFFNVLTSNAGNENTNDLSFEKGNHHRYWKGGIQHTSDDLSNVLKYPTDKDDDHPSRAGNLKATEEFRDLINIYYNEWRE